MAKESATFQEIGRVKVSPNTEVVVSAVSKQDGITGININTYVTSERFTGFTRGILIPNDKIAEFNRLMQGIGA